MKIEKVNENQIRCTLTKEDLVSRDLKISELAYGSEKAKTLFRDMMRKANQDFGFEAEDIPLMIEAIPLNAECIVLIITKVEDPEELDTRFSKFAPSVTEDEDPDAGDLSEDFDEALDALSKLQGLSLNKEQPVASEETVAKEPPQLIRALFRMDSLKSVIDACRLLKDHYNCGSSLFKDGNGAYYLMLQDMENDSLTCQRACNTISEYGVLQKSVSLGRSFLTEHCEKLIAADAIKILGSL